MATKQSEMDSFMNKFFQLLHSGETAQLTLESYNGQLYVNLRAALPHYPHQQFPEHHHHRQQVPSPSRLRRRARRAAVQNVKTCANEAAYQATRDDTDEKGIQTQNAATKVDVAVQATENLVPASSDVAVEASLSENPQFENTIPNNHVDQLDPTSSPIPHPQHNLYPAQEQPHHDRGRTTEQVVLSADAHEIGHGFLTHPNSPHPHKTHPGRYNYCCDHRCNTGRRRTNSGTRLTDEKLCCDHTCTG